MKKVSWIEYSKLNSANSEKEIITTEIALMDIELQVNPII